MAAARADRRPGDNAMTGEESGPSAALPQRGPAVDRKGRGRRRSPPAFPVNYEVGLRWSRAPWRPSSCRTHVGGQRNQTLGREIAVVAHRLVGGVFVDELLEAGDDADVLLLEVDEQRTRAPCTCRRRSPRRSGRRHRSRRPGSSRRSPRGTSSRRCRPRSGLASSFWTIRLSFSPASI